LYFLQKVLYSLLYNQIKPRKVMKKILLLLTAFTWTFASVAQMQMDLPCNFNDAGVTYSVVGFGGADASTIEMDPTDMNNTVVKVIKSATAEIWAGTSVTDLGNPGFANPIPFASNLTTMTLRVWSPDAGIVVRLKVEQIGNNAVTCETDQLTTVAGEWETLTFNFANPATGTQTLNLSSTFNLASVFFNYGTLGSAVGEKTYYFDDLAMGEPVVTLLDQMDLPVTFEDENVEYGLIGFGGAEASSIEMDPTDMNNTVAKVIKSATAQGWAGTTVTNSLQQGFVNGVPFTAENTQMTVRVWSPDAGIPVRLKVEASNDNTISCETDAFTTVAGQWETLTFDFANEGAGTAELNLANNYNKASIFFNYNVPGDVTGEKTYYFDDIQMGSGGGGGSTDFNVTFKVDMSQVTQAFTTPEVNGFFNDWCGGCAPMMDVDGDNIWEITIPLPAGTYEYKFAADSWTIQEALVPGSECTLTTGNFTNRIITVSEDIVLDPVCWNSCSACGIISGPYNVTFKVDMSQVAATFTTPEVNGIFNGWCGGCAPMADADGDNIWELTIPLNAGTYEYKFAADNWGIQEELTPGSSCTLTTDGFTNRVVTVEGEMTMPTVCWASCAACIVGLDEATSSNTFSVFPNPANDKIFINGLNNTGAIAKVRIFNTVGSLVSQSTIQTVQNPSIDVSSMENGVYFVEVEVLGVQHTQKVMIQH
jgi:hypothetical protein